MIDGARISAPPHGARGHARPNAPVAGELQHRLLFEHNPLPMMVYDRTTQEIVAVSNSAVATYGYSREEFLKLTLWDLIPPEDHDGLKAFLTTSLEQEHPGLLLGQPIRHVTKDGRMIDVDVTGDDLDVSGRSCRITLCQDVTARNRAMAELDAAREELHRSEQEHRLLFERNPHPMIAYDCGTLRIVAVSDAAVASFGYSREEFLQMTLLDMAPPEDHAAMLDYARTHRGVERLGLQRARPRRHLCKDGSILDVEVTSDDLMLGGSHCRVCLCLDVSERNRANAELAVARDQAVEASNMKSAFLANMSHEIRTPMNGVIGMTELLLDMGLSGEQRECAEQIARSGEQMLEIINDILDLSKIETGHLELDILDFDLHATIADTCAVADAQTRAKGLTLEVVVPDGVPRRVRGDGRRLRQVLLNLVTNAVKFTSAGAVVVRADATTLPDGTGHSVSITVADSGIGIDPGALERMFDPFTQADSSTTRLYGGTGLGLAIARELVELMGGTIDATSEPGRGSTFRFDVHLAPPLADGEMPGDDGAQSAAAATWDAPPLVLIVEDSQINQIVASRALERCGCRVEVAGNGREALEALAARHFDAVLMDCQMPEMDGYEATAELRRREQRDGGHTPVIAMTAQAMDGDRERCLAAGMDDYVTKPMRHAELGETLHRWIAARGAAQG